jgi:hypothetical protein
MKLYLHVVASLIAFTSFAYAGDFHDTFVVNAVVPLSVPLVSLHSRGLRIQRPNKYGATAIVLSCDSTAFSGAPIINWELVDTLADGSQTYLGTKEECEQSVVAIYKAAHNNEEITVDINEPLDSVTVTDSKGKYLLVH